MSDFLKKASSKISKLSPDQIERLLDEVSSKNSVLSSVMESLPTGIAICDNNLFLIKANKAASRLLFGSRKTESETPLCDLIEEKKISHFLMEAFEKRKTNVSSEFSVEVHGKTRFINVTMNPFVQNLGESSSGKIMGVTVTVEDITEKRTQEILMRRMENLAGLTTLAASVAHEIKNPLGAISIHIQLLQKAVKKAREKDGLLPDKKFLENYLDVVNEEIENLNKIVLDFLFAVRPVHASFELLDPDEIIKKTAEFFKPEFAQKGVSIVQSLSEQKSTLLIDGKLFKEVLINLMKNALYAMEKGGQLTLSSSVEGEKYILLVKDTGCGMDTETASKIFEPYFTTKADGTGLGLTMVYKIIKEFNGDISASSVKDEGTVFTVTLPVPQKKTMLLGCSGGNAK
ncbi:MAG: PAS domain-containing protein [Treponema sp.]|nr:PAS domain-containing protein [Treponema sp.]